MAANTLVRVRIDPRIKEEAADILATTGLTVSDAFRLMLVRTAETIEAMRAARSGDTKHVKTPENLFVDRHADD